MRTLFVLAAVVVVVAGMRAAEPILVPFLLAVFIAVIFAPPLFWLRRKGIPQWLALLLIVSGIVSLGMVLAALLGTSVDGFSETIPQYQQRLNSLTAQALDALARHGIDVPRSLLLERFDPGAAMQLAASMLAGFGNVLKNSFLILLTVVFMLMEASSVPQKIHRVFDDAGASKAVAGFDEFAKTLHRYLAIKTATSLATGTIVTLWLWTIGVDYALVWGVLAFLLNFIPNIGSIIAAVPAVLLALVQIGLGAALAAAGGYLAINVVVGSIIEPRFMGRGLGLSTLVVFLSLVFWGWVLGPVGMLLSVPLTMTLKIAFASSPRTSWLAGLLGPADIEASTVDPGAARASLAAQDASPSKEQD